MPPAYTITSDIGVVRSYSGISNPPLLMGDLLQQTLFGEKQEAPVTHTALTKAYNAIAESLVPHLNIPALEHIAFFQVNAPFVPRYHLTAQVQHLDGTQGFLKIGRGEIANRSLRFEYASILAAQQLGYPPILHPLRPYTEIADGLAFLELEFINFGKDGFTALAESPQLIDPTWGTKLADIMISGFDRPLPSTVNLDSLRVAEQQLTSADTYFKAFGTSNRRSSHPNIIGKLKHWLGVGLNLSQHIHAYASSSMK